MESTPDITPHRGRFVGNAHHFALHVYYEDTDFTGIVYHANYLRYMERARTDMLACAGIDQRAAHEAGEGAYAVADLHIRYMAPAKFDDDLLVVSRVTDIRGASTVIVQDIWRGEQQLVHATVTAAFLSPSGRPKRQPKEWTSAFAKTMSADA